MKKKTGLKHKTRILKFSIYTKEWTVPYLHKRVDKAKFKVHPKS